MLSSQALPRLGRHASRLPCKPCKGLRCTGLARRAAVGALPLKTLAVMVMIRRGDLRSPAPSRGGVTT